MTSENIRHSPDTGGGSGGGPEKKTDFQPSWLIQNEEELNSLPSGKDFSARVRRLHLLAQQPETLRREKWEDFAELLVDLSVKEDIPDEVAAMFIGNFAKFLSEESQKKEIPTQTPVVNKNTEPKNTPNEPPVPARGEDWNEQWKGWLIQNGKEEYESIPPKLRALVRSVAERPPLLLDADKLKELYEKIDELTRDEKSGVTFQDAETYKQRIAEQAITLIQHRESKAANRELPLHIGAVFEKGKNRLLVEHESIPILDIKDQWHREAYILENLHAFNVLFRQPAQWKTAVDIWISDVMIAAQAEDYNGEVLERFIKKMKAMMAVTSSARAMELSAGAASSYVAVLTGGEKGYLDAQDTWSDYLLHADPEKLNLVLDDPLVKRYYLQLMADAGLKYDDNHRWRKVPDPDKPGKLIDRPSIVELRRGVTPEDVRERSRLVMYLKTSAERGGFDKYINEVLLALDPPKRQGDLETIGIGKDSRWAAARLACDAFLVDIWTRWENIVTEEGEKSLDLQPTKEWGGDPLSSIIKPSGLPRLKGVYKGELEVLDLMDKGFRPDDILSGANSKDMIVPSLVTNLKKIARYTSAIETFLGGSMATGIPDWSSKVTSDEGLLKVADLLTQLYGKVKLMNTDGREIFPDSGKHLVGLMMLRLTYAKVLATAEQTPRPGWRDLFAFYYDPHNRERPLMEVMQYLYGPRLDGKTGFFRNLSGTRTELAITNNRLNESKILLDKAWDVLQTNDQLGGGIKAKIVRAVAATGKLFEIIAKNFGEK